MRKQGTRNVGTQAAPRRDPRVPFVLPYLDLIVLIALCWFFRDWLIHHVEPLATFVLQEMGDPFDWLVPLSVAAPVEPMPVEPMLIPQPTDDGLLI